MVDGFIHFKGRNIKLSYLWIAPAYKTNKKNGGERKKDLGIST